MKQISAALVKAQKEFGPALKTHTNPAFRRKYADLSACIEAVVDALNNNGIMLMQPLHECELGVTVETVFLHESGEQISSGKLHVPAVKQDPQGYGSAITYARRYSLMAACGIAPEDDDGNAASKPASKPQNNGPSLIDQYRAASLQGMHALKAFHSAQPASPAKKAIWDEHGDSLKKAADQSDLTSTV